MKSFLDRIFLVASENGGIFRHKTGAAVVVVRRSGGSAALDSLNHYLSHSEILIATSHYWNWLLGMRENKMLTPQEEPESQRGMNLIMRHHGTVGRFDQ